MNARQTHLKIKIQTLTDEARHIRREERKALKHARANRPIDGHSPYPDSAKESERALRTYRSLNGHRRGIVRWTARHNQLAYACLKGTPYSKVEQKCKTLPDWDVIRKITRRFGADDIQVDAWINADRKRVA